MQHCYHHQLNNFHASNEELLQVGDYITNVQRVVQKLDATREEGWQTAKSCLHERRLSLRRQTKFKLHELYEQLQQFFLITERDISTVFIGTDAAAS